MRVALRRTIVLLLEMTYLIDLVLLFFLKYMNFLYKLYGLGTYISFSFTFQSLHFPLKSSALHDSFTPALHTLNCFDLDRLINHVTGRLELRL